MATDRTTNMKLCKTSRGASTEQSPKWPPRRENGADYALNRKERNKWTSPHFPSVSPSLPSHFLRLLSVVNCSLKY